MFRSIRAVTTKSRQAKANARRLLLESLEQRQLLSISPAPGLALTDLATAAAIYGPVQAGAAGLATNKLPAEGEGVTLPAPSAARQLLFAGIASSTASPTNPGLLTIIDAPADSPTDTIVPWNAPLVTGGIAGLAFDVSGRLYAAVDQGPCTPSELVELSPANGAVLRRLPIMAGSTAINIGDLAVEPATGRLFGIRSLDDVSDHAGELFVIDVDSGEATFVGDTGAGAGEALAFAANGGLYLAGTAGGKAVLYQIDPDTAEPHQRDAVTGLAVPFVVLNDPTGRLKEVEGLAGHPDNGTLVATTSKNRFAGNQIVDDTFAIDLASGRVTAQPLASPARGIFGDLAFQPSPRVLDIVYQENFENGNGGFVADNTGGTLPGLWHYSLGRRYDSLPSHTPISSFYYGAFETAFGGGHYVLPLDHQGTLTSSPIQLPTSSVLSFNYLLETRPELDVDFVDVSVITADGNVTQILSRADGTLPQTGSHQWRTATADLSAFACQAIQLQFFFDTGPVPQIDPEGWYLDDVMIGSTGGFCDFGDAPDDPTNPDDYPTLLTSNGARHAVSADLYLGRAVDLEADGQPTPMADGDDRNPAAGPDDEDGVTFMTLVAGGQGGFAVELTNTSGHDAFLDAWIDFNQDGDWSDIGEQVLTAQPITAGSNSFDITVPPAAQSGETIARFRLSSLGGLPVTGYAPDGEVEDYVVTIEAADPRIVITKAGTFNDENGDSFAMVGETISYTFEVSNDGNVPLSSVVVSDTMAADITLNGGDTNMNGLLDIDETWLYSGSYTLTQADVNAGEKQNTALASAFDPLGNPATDEDTITTLLPNGNPALSIVKSGTFDDGNGNALADAGEKINYMFVVTNGGRVTLSHLVVSDAMVNNISFEGGDTNMNGLLDVAETWAYSGSYTLTQTDIDAGEKENTAFANATDPQGNPISGSSTITTTLPVMPKIEIVKTGSWRDANSDGRPDVGDTIEYEFKVTNAGNATLFHVTITDPLLTVAAGSGLTDEDGDGTQDDLRPGAMATATGSYALTEVDVASRMKVNTASVDATSPSGDAVHDDDTATVLLPSIGIVKTNTSPGGWNDSNGNGRPDTGETVEYEFRITNDGKLTLLDVTVADSMVTVSPLGGGLTNEDGDDIANDMLPGALAMATGTYTLTQADIAAGQKTNTATVSATDPDGNPIRGEDTVRTDFVPRSSISGRVFSDVNGNAAKDSFEAGINFVTVQLFADANGNGLLDDGAAPLQQITMGDGDYEFGSLAPGAYIVAVLDSTAPDSVLTTGNDPMAVVLDVGNDATIDFGYQSVIQFVTPLGYFSTQDGTSAGFRDGIPSDVVVPFVRPADDFLVDVLVRDSNDDYQLPALLASLELWQSFTIRNTTSVPLEISQLNKIVAQPGSDQFVKVFSRQQLDDLAAKEAGGTTITVQELRGITNDDLSSNPILLGTDASNDHVTFFAFYQPVERSTAAAGEAITRQLPEWSNDPTTAENETLVDGKAHTFSREDRLEVVTRFAADSGTAGQTPPIFQFQFVGGSTYDSDISDYNGRVQAQDFQFLNDVILLRQLPVTQNDPPWDPTTDVNVRFPNGAEGAVGGVWSASTLREVGLGDYGIFNVELPRKSRAPFLDLNASSSTSAVGVDYQTSTSGSPVLIASSNAQFGNDVDQRLDSLIVSLTNPLGSDQIRIDESELPPTIVATGNGTPDLTLHSVAVAGQLLPTVRDYADVLAKITYSSGSSPAVPGIRVITIQAIGSAFDFTFTANNLTLDQTVGNIAISRIAVVPVAN